MKLSDLTKTLEEAIERYGDREVLILGRDKQGVLKYTEEISLHKGRVPQLDEGVVFMGPRTTIKNLIAHTSRKALRLVKEDK